jgi:hypothetical protein
MFMMELIRMSLERATMAFAGLMVLVSIVLTVWVHPLFVWLTVFVGANLAQSAFTGFCPVAMLMHRLGVRSERECLLSVERRDSARRAA